jgi:hypothetical protein
MIRLTLADDKSYPFLLNNKVFTMLRLGENKLDVISGDGVMDASYIAYLGLREGAAFEGSEYPYDVAKTESMISLKAALMVADELNNQIKEASDYAKEKIANGKK